MAFPLTVLEAAVFEPAVFEGAFDEGALEVLFDAAALPPVSAGAVLDAAVPPVAFAVFRPALPALFTVRAAVFLLPVRAAPGPL